MFIDDLLQYIRTRNPGFGDHNHKMPDVMIEEIESTWGRPLPIVYRQYLETMGLDSGGVLFKDRDLNILSIVDYLQSTYVTYPEERYGMLALHNPPADIVSRLNWFFDFESGQAIDDCFIVAFDDRGAFEHQVVLPVYDSFQELLTSWAFRTFSLDPRQSQVSLQYGEEKTGERFSFDKAISVLTDLGFIEVLPRTPNNWVAENGKNAVQVDALPHHEASFFVHLASRVNHELRATRRALGVALGASREV